MLPTMETGAYNLEEFEKWRDFFQVQGKSKVIVFKLIDSFIHFLTHFSQSNYLHWHWCFFFQLYKSTTIGSTDRGWHHLIQVQVRVRGTKAGKAISLCRTRWSETQELIDRFGCCGVWSLYCHLFSSISIISFFFMFHNPQGRFLRHFLLQVLVERWWRWLDGV